MSDGNDSPWQASFSEISVSLADSIFVILDLETSGSAPNAGVGITEIGAIKVRGGEEIARFNSLVNPQTPIPPYITELTGITDAMLAQQPPIKSVLPEFLEFLGTHEETVLVAHNSEFDLSFLKSAARKTEIKWPDFRVINTVRFARKVVEKYEVGNYKLSTLASYFETDTTPSHRAMADVEATVGLFHKLIERVSGFNVYTLEDLLNYLG